MPHDALGGGGRAGGDPGAGGRGGGRGAAAAGGRGLTTARAARLALAALPAALSLLSYAPDAQRLSLVAGAAAALLGLYVGWRSVEAAALLLAGAAPVLAGLPRRLGDPTDPPVLLTLACATLAAALARRLADAEPSPLPRAVRAAAWAFLLLASASALSSAIRGETLYLLLRGGAEPLYLNELALTAGDRSRDALRLFLVHGVLLLSLETFWRAFFREGARERLLVAVAAGASISFAEAVLSPGRDGTYWGLMERAGGLATDPNALGVFVGLLVPPLLALAPSLRGLSRLPVFAALLLSPLALQRSGSRSGLIVLAVAAVAAGVGLFRARPAWRRPLALAALLCLVSGLLVVKFAPREGYAGSGGLFQRLGSALRQRSLQDLTSHRTIFWRMAFDILREEPVSGCGLGGFIYEFPVRTERQTGKSPDFSDNATNSLLDLAAECGAPGLILALLASIPLLSRSLDAVLSRVDAGALARASGAAVAGLAVASMTGSHFRFTEVALLFALVTAVAAQAPGEAPPGESPDGAASSRRLFVLAAAGALASAFMAARTLEPEAAFRAGPWVGLYAWEREGGVPVRRWMGEQAFRLVDPSERSLTLAFQNARPDRRPVAVRADVEGKAVGALEVPGGERRSLVIALPAAARVVRLRASPTFVPADVAGKDRRRLSIQILHSPGEDAPQGGGIR